MRFKWKEFELVSERQLQQLQDFMGYHKPKHIFLDTETTGLHIIRDRPFVVQFGFVINQEGLAIAVDLETRPGISRKTIDAMLKYTTGCELLVGHNLSFDLHMLRNIGYKYTRDNVTDTTFYIRHGHDTRSIKNGGPDLRLKNYAAQYIDARARDHDQALKQERTAIAAQYNRDLVKRMGMKKGAFDEFFKDPVNDLEDLPLEKVQAFQEWKASLPSWLSERFDIRLESNHVPYNKLHRPTLIKYALKDIVYTAEVFYQLRDVVSVRKNMTAVNLDSSLIQPLVDMERTGFKVDTAYLEQSRIRMKEYILNKRRKLYELACKQVKTGQHVRIKGVLRGRYNLVLNSTNSQELSRIADDLKRTGDNPQALEFINTLGELRTLEKWYSVYIMRFIREARNTGTLYTTINQVGAVSGRVTSDFQQFPKYGITTDEKEELFHPRKMVKVTGGPYSALVYIDYSQIELRLQAMYTILVGHPDKNLCRAYMPYECHDLEGKLFDPTDPKDIERWHEPWYQKEDQKLWKPVDVHGATTEQAFDITPDHPDFKKLRSVGKTVNFCKNYGGQRGQIESLFPEYSSEQITKIDNAYYKAFPGVRMYHDYCYKLAMSKAYATNLLGIRYYNVNGHNLINMLIQGSGAYFLKLKLRQLWVYMKAKGYKSRIQMNIHDEISWVYHQDDPPEIFLEFRQIMEEWSDALVPITADIEISTTTWAEKKEIENEEEIYTCLSQRSRVPVSAESSRVS